MPGFLVLQESDARFADTALPRALEEVSRGLRQLYTTTADETALPFAIAPLLARLDQIPGPEAAPRPPCRRTEGIFPDPLTFAQP